MINILGFEIHNKFVYAFITLIVSYIAYKLLLRIINKSFTLRMKRNKVKGRRQKTIHIIIKNTLKYTFGIIVLLILLGLLGINTNAIIASVGIIGLAVGLAIQDTLRDILAGIFILADNQYAVGDIVTIGNFQGEVVFLGLKSTKLRSENGEIKILANRNISEVTNYSLHRATFFIDVPLAYNNDEKLVAEAFTALINNLSEKMSDIDCEFRYQGILSIDDKVTYRLSVSSDIKYQQQIKREVLSSLKDILEEKKIRR